MILFEGDHIYLENSTLLAENIHLYNSSNAERKGCCITFYKSVVHIRNAVFDFFSKNCLYGVKSKLTVFNSSFSNNTLLSLLPPSLPPIFLLNCSSILLFHILFTRNQGVQGGGLHLEGGEEAVVNESVFLENEGIEGGGGWIVNQKVRIEGCRFEMNKGVNGGGLFVRTKDGMIFKFI